MYDTGQLAAEILVANDVSSGQEKLIARELGDLGVVATTRVVPARRGAGELTWLLLATLPLQAFLSRLGAVVAEDAAHKLQRIVGRVFENRHKRPSNPEVVVFQDAATRLQVALEADLPAEAYRQLVGLDLSTFRVGPIHYDRQVGKWRSEVDEWEKSQKSPSPSRDAHE